MSKKYIPLGAKVLVLLDDQEESTSKITLTADQLRDALRERNTTEGNVVSIGIDLSLLSDQEIQHTLKVGSRVKFKENVGAYVSIHDKDHLVLDISDLIYVEVEEKEALHLV